MLTLTNIFYTELFKIINPSTAIQYSNTMYEVHNDDIE